MSKGLTKTEVKNIVKDEINKHLNDVFMKSLVKELKSKSSPINKEIIEIIRNAMVSVHKFMWMRRGTWLNDIK